MMIICTSASASVADRTCGINPMHLICVGATAIAPWQVTPEEQQQFDRLQAAYPGARAEILLAGGRSVLVLEAPAEVLAKIEEWGARAEKRTLALDGGPK